MNTLIQRLNIASVALDLDHPGFWINSANIKKRDVIIKCVVDEVGIDETLGATVDAIMAFGVDSSAERFTAWFV